MGQVNINIRMDEGLKRDFDGLCSDLGLTMTAAFNVFAKAMVRQQKIPFEVSMNVPNADTSGLGRSRADEKRSVIEQVRYGC